MPKQKSVRDINAQRDVVMGNQYNYSADLTRVESLLDQIIALLRDSHVRIEVGGDLRDSILVVGGGNQVSLTKQDVGLFAKLQATANPAKREEIYLARLVLKETHARWEKSYLPLAGFLLEPSLRLSDRSDQGLSAAGVSLGDIREAIHEYKKTRFVILGDPGCGKTTTLSRLVLELARERLNNPLHAPLPVWVDLFNFTGADQQPNDFLEALWRNTTGLANTYGQSITGDKVCFLLDGVNQMPTQNRSRLIDRWAHWANEGLHEGNWAIFTCREADYTASLRLPEVRVNLLDEKQMHQYFQIRFGEIDHEKHWGEFEKRLRSGNDRFEKLARNPFMLNLMVDRALAGETFGDSRAILMQDLAERLIRRELESGRQPEALTADPLGTGRAMMEALSRLAFAMQAKGEGTGLIRALAEKTPLAERGGANLLLDDILELAVAATILEKTDVTDDDPSKTVYAFYHHLLQEYFAAAHLLKLFRKGKNLSKYWNVNWRWWQFSPLPLRKGRALPTPPVTGWEETLTFSVALSGRDAERMITAVAKSNLPLAGRCLAEVKGRDNLNPLAEKLRNDLLNRQRSTHAHLRARIDAGLALGEIGHPELRPQQFTFGEKEVWAILPPMQEIPAGEFLFGSDLSDKDAYNNEKTTERKMTLPAFSVGRYPVTNAEFKHFVDAGGYKDDRWWTAEGLAWKQGGANAHEGAIQNWLDTRKFIKDFGVEKAARQWNMRLQEQRFWAEVTQLDDDAAQERARKLFDRPFDRPGYWDDPALSSPARPVVGVNWYEASAYSNWLSAVTGKNFRLPTEFEWERAARGEDGRVYPWGNEFDPRKCSSAEGQIYRTTPIGLFPNGVSPHGIFEASGNVWEWTASWFKAYPGQAEDHSDDYGEKFRTVRGGSWGFNRGAVRCAVRNGDVPDDFSSSSGFRLVSPGS